MSLFNSLRTSISGMTAQTQRMDTVADNIANSSTTGYKRASAEFESVMSNSQSRSYTSGGVLATTRHSISAQGSLRSTNSATDLAVQGNGFFYVTNPEGAPGLTRAGAFTTDAEGFLKNTGGFYLMGYRQDSANPNNPSTNNINDLERINISQNKLAVSPSTNGQFSANLPSNAELITGPLPSTNGPNSTFTAKSSIVTFDDLGNKIVLDIYLSKTAANEWEISIYNAADASPTGFPYSSAAVATQTLQFDGSSGALVTPTDISLNIPNGQPFTLNLKDMTQLATNYQVFSTQTNGNAPSNIDRIEISNDGILSVVFQNGTRSALYRIPLATVTSPDNLVPLSGNVYSESIDSGNVIIGNANNSAFGRVLSSFLESSTVDLGSELTSMIETQRTYTANSKVFKTSAEMLEVLMSIRT